MKGDNFNKTVKTDANGNISVAGLFPGTYTVTEQSIDRYEPQKTQTVTLIGGKTSTVNFNNTLKRGSLEVIKTSEDKLVEGVTFHLYGTSLSGLPVDEYAVTDKNGVAKFPNILISGNTPYVVEEVDTAIRYVVPASQTAPIEWNKVTDRSFTNVLKKFQVTVTKTDKETGTPQGYFCRCGLRRTGDTIPRTKTVSSQPITTCAAMIDCPRNHTDEGYLLDPTIHKVGAEQSLYRGVQLTANDVNEQVIKAILPLSSTPTTEKPRLKHPKKVRNLRSI
ncbi:MAG: collagen binding domain-containing protein [Pseudoruminococcus massiliensis]|uniref:MSCRAMM family protein n=1 Tax=Pseudoruminococcus massiliensis TaxID=2086583 RepID=UPI0039945099